MHATHSIVASHTYCWYISRCFCCRCFCCCCLLLLPASLMSLLNAPGFWCMQQIVQFIASMAVDEAESTMFLQALNIVIKLSVSVVVGVIVLCLLLLLCGIAIITLVAIGFYTRHVGLFNTRTYTCTTSCNIMQHMAATFVQQYPFHVCHANCFSRISTFLCMLCCCYCCTLAAVHVCVVCHCNCCNLPNTYTYTYIHAPCVLLLLQLLTLFLLLSMPFIRRHFSANW